jgi:hypothetical protein
VPGRKLDCVDRFHHDGIVSESEARPFVDDVARAQIWIPREAPKTVQICHGHRAAEPVRVEAYVRHSHEAAKLTMERAAGREVFHRSRAPGHVRVRVHVKIERFLPHRHEKTKMPLLARVLLRDLEFDRFVGLLEPTQERRYRFANLKIDWAVLDLDDDVVVELAVERVKDIVSGSSAVVLRIAPIKVVVVDERAIEEDAGVRLQRPREHVGCVGWGAPERGRPGAALRIRFHHEPAKVRNQAINLVHLFGPPLRDGWFQRVERVESSDRLGADEIDRDSELHSPRAERVGDARELWQKVGHEHARIRVHVVDHASVDPQRREQARVVAHAREVVANVAAVEKDRAAAVAALDAAVEVVPLIHPANRSVRLALDIEVLDVLFEGDFAKQGKNAIQHAAVGGSRDDETTETANSRGGEHECVAGESGGRLPFGSCCV